MEGVDAPQPIEHGSSSSAGSDVVVTGQIPGPDSDVEITGHKPGHVVVSSEEDSDVPIYTDEQRNATRVEYDQALEDDRQNDLHVANRWRRHNKASKSRKCRKMAKARHAEDSAALQHEVASKPKSAIFKIQLPTGLTRIPDDCVQSTAKLFEFVRCSLQLGEEFELAVVGSPDAKVTDEFLKNPRHERCVLRVVITNSVSHSE